MKIFGSKSLSYLGIDLGNAGIKIVELKNESGRPRLVTYGYAEFPSTQAKKSVQGTEDEVAGLINKICNEAKTTTKKAISALPNFSVFSSIISLPQMPKKELDQAVAWEAKKFIPLPITEMNLYWEIVSQAKNKKEKQLEQNLKKSEVKQEEIKKIDTPRSDSGVEVKFSSDQIEGLDKNLSKEEIKKKIEQRANVAKAKEHLKILVIAAPKKRVNRYLNIFQKAKLDLITLETESFALERSLIGKEEAPIMIVDIGAISSDLTVVDKGIPVLNRSVDIGGSNITKHIAASIKVDLKRAEQFKKDIGFSKLGSANVPKVVASAIEPIINEIRYCFDLYSSQEEKNKKVEKIILTGGSAFLPNLTEYLSKLLDIKVIIGDPWTRVIYPIELKPVLDELGPKFSVAIGLAMREIE